MTTFKWIIEFEVTEIWVAGGFDLTADRALDMLGHDLQFASTAELGAKVIKAPSPALIRKAQGYRD